MKQLFADWNEAKDVAIFAISNARSVMSLFLLASRSIQLGYESADFQIPYLLLTVRSNTGGSLVRYDALLRIRLMQSPQLVRRI